MHEPFNITIRNSATALVAALVWIAQSFFLYRGNSHIFYVDVYQFILGKFSYVNDIYLNEPFILKSSFFYKFVQLTGLNLDNDFVAFPINVVFSAAAAFYVWRLVRDFQFIEGFSSSLLLVVLVAYINRSFLQTQFGSIISVHSNSPTMLVHYAMFPLFYCVLTRRMAVAALLASAMMAIAVKAAWAPIGICVAFAVLRPSPNLRSAAWFLLPAATAFLMSKNAVVPIDFELRRQLSEIVLLRDGMEDAITWQPLPNLLLFVASFPVYVWLATRIEHAELRRFLLTICFVTAAIAAFGALYTSIGYKIYPNPALILLSPVRATDVYHLFFFVMLYGQILRSSLPWQERFGMTAAVYLATYSLQGLLLVPLVLVAGFLSRMAHWIGIQVPIPRVLHWSAVVPALVSIAVLPTQTYWRHSEFNIQGAKDIGKWTAAAVDADTWKALIRLRSCHNDFILLVLNRDAAGGLAFAGHTPGSGPDPAGKPGDYLLYESVENAVAGKSKFIGDYASFYLNLSGFEEHVRRHQLVQDITGALGQGSPLPDAAIARLRAYQLAVLTEQVRAPQMRGASSVWRVTTTRSLFVFEPGNWIADAVADCGGDKL